jgi:hypothetical protein
VLTDQQIINLRDECLPPQGQAFDCLEFARKVERRSRIEVDDLAMLTARLAHSLKKASPDSDLPGRALDYLKRHGLQEKEVRAV